MMSDLSVWEQVAKTSSSRQPLDESLQLVLNASQGKRLRSTGTTNKRSKTHKDTNLQYLLNKIGPALL